MFRSNKVGSTLRSRVNAATCSSRRETLMVVKSRLLFISCFKVLLFVMIHPTRAPGTAKDLDMDPVTMVC